MERCRLERFLNLESSSASAATSTSAAASTSRWGRSRSWGAEASVGQSGEAAHELLEAFLVDCVDVRQPGLDPVKTVWSERKVLAVSLSNSRLVGPKIGDVHIEDVDCRHGRVASCEGAGPLSGLHLTGQMAGERPCGQQSGLGCL